jgi:autotransporter-associated beta strand protein
MVAALSSIEKHTAFGVARVVRRAVLIAVVGGFASAMVGHPAAAQVISLNAGESYGYKQYTYTTTAASSTTWLSFFFRQDPSWWGFDDVSFVPAAGGGNLVTNPGFESGTSGWTLVGQQGLPYAGRVASGSPGNGYGYSRSGSRWWLDGAVGGADGIAQSVATTVGDSYTLSFWLAGGSGGGPNSSSVLFKAFVGNQVSSAYVPQFTQVSTGTVTSGTVAAQSGQQLNVQTATGGAIDSTGGYASVGTFNGATLTTGSYGAAITTFSSGTVNSAANSNLTVGSFSSGLINAGSNASVTIDAMQSGNVATGVGSQVSVGTLSSGSIAIAAGGAVNVTQGGDFDGSISGGGSLVMRGSDTLTMNSPSTYTGGTEIVNGTVRIAAGDAIGDAPIVILNNGRFQAMSNVDVNNQIVSRSSGAVYEHVFDTNDPLTNYGAFSYAYGATALLGAGDPLTTTGTVSSQFAYNGTLTLEGLDGTAFLLVLNMADMIPADVSADDYYLGWFDTVDQTWKRATLGNHGANGDLAGGYAGLSYQNFLSSNSGWNSARMLGAYGVDWVNDQVWAVIDHNSEFGVALDGQIHFVPEPSTYAMAWAGLACAAWAGFRKRRRIGSGRSPATAA